MSDIGPDDGHANASCPAQDDILAFLGNVSRDGQPVHRIDTHAASVFLSGDRALKIKRAVRFPFLDYSTLARRKAACEQELAINKLFAPQLYLRTVPIVRSADGSLHIGGDGDPVEWAVEMIRFDHRATLDHLVEHGPLPPELAIAIADEIYAAHDAAPSVRGTSWVSSLRGLIKANTAAFIAEGVFPPGSVAQLEHDSLAVFETVRDLLVRRTQSGHVRRCHGDLHLANIAVIAGHPVLFDAIEFDPALATTDVLYDLAFPLMDLLHARQPDAANALFNRYLSRGSADNAEGLAALPLFLSLRAAIRANVLLKQRHRASARPADASGYFDLAGRLLQDRPALLVAIGGLSGTGKSRLGRDLAPLIGRAPGAVLLRSDVLRKRSFGTDEHAALPAHAYTTEITAEIYRSLADRARTVLLAGHAAIADAVYARTDERAAIASIARKLGLPFVGLFLTADLDTRIRRIGDRIADASDATADIARQQEHYDLGAIAWVTIDASGRPGETLSRALLAIDGAPHHTAQRCKT